MCFSDLLVVVPGLRFISVWFGPSAGLLSTRPDMRLSLLNVELLLHPVPFPAHRLVPAVVHPCNPGSLAVTVRAAKGRDLPCAAIP